MKVYLRQNVLEAAEARMRRVFDITENVAVSFSGGKDSTVILELAIREATRRNRLPLDVVFVDQEHEWEDTIAYARRVAQRPEVRFHWFQVPLDMENSANPQGGVIKLWGEHATREREPGAITTPPFECTRFHKIFPLIMEWLHPGERSIQLVGIRGEESPARLLALVRACHEEITWGKRVSSKPLRLTLWPIYDWAVSDVWLFIHSNKIDYCDVYNKMYAAGYRITDMRVSNLHHETAVRHLEKVQELCHTTWERLSPQVAGAHTIRHMTRDVWRPRELPWMFSSWTEYRDYLLDSLTPPERVPRLRELFAASEAKIPAQHRVRLLKEHVNMILIGDMLGIKLKNFTARLNMSAK